MENTKIPGATSDKKREDYNRVGNFKAGMQDGAIAAVGDANSRDTSPQSTPSPSDPNYK